MLVFIAFYQLSSDREHVNVPIVLGLLKATGPTLITPSSNTEAASADQEKNAAAASESAGVRENNSESTLLSAEIRAKFRKLFETYFATLSKRIVKEHSVSALHSLPMCWRARGQD